MLKELGYKPFRPTLVQGLLPGDPQQRLNFANSFLARANADQEFINKIWYSDEATFNLNGTVNRRNDVYWAEQNPNRIIEKSLKSIGLTCWAAVSSEGIIGKKIFNNNC